MTIRNKRGLKGTLSTKISLEYVDLAVTREERVTFEAENNLDFRLGTGALRYTKVAEEGDLACITRLSDTKFQLRFVRSADPKFATLDKLAVSFVGHQGKRYGFVPNDEFGTLMGITLP